MILIAGLKILLIHKSFFHIYIVGLFRCVSGNRGRQKTLYEDIGCILQDEENGLLY